VTARKALPHSLGEVARRAGGGSLKEAPHHSQPQFASDPPGRPSDAHWEAIYVDRDDRTMTVEAVNGWCFRVNITASFLPQCQKWRASPSILMVHAGTAVLHDVLGARPIVADQPGGPGLVYRPPPCDPEFPLCEYRTPPPFPKLH
jgi:hypothetical protein